MSQETDELGRDGVMDGAKAKQRGRRGFVTLTLWLAAGSAIALPPAIPTVAANALPVADGAAFAGVPTGFYYDGYTRGQTAEQAARPGLGRVTGLRAGAADEAAGEGDGASSAAGFRRLSAARSIGASLLVPGWGQHLAGRDGRARAFLTTEVVLIGAFIGFRIQGKVRQERYIDYAELFAGVAEADGKSDGYYRNLGRYPSTVEYEDDLMRDARARFGDDVEQREAYVADRRPEADEAWRWESEAHRKTFTEMRKDSRSSFHQADQVIGIILLNHILSAVDAGRLARRSDSGKALYLGAGPDGTSYVGLSWSFNE